MRNFSCKNKDSAFPLFLIIFPDSYSLFMQLLENLVFVEFPCFLLFVKMRLSFFPFDVWDGWMDDLRFYVLFNSVSVISGQ